MKRAGRVSARYKLWLEAEGCNSVFGSGKLRLLRAIQRNGSLSAAAADLGISYRKAWGDIRKTERALGVKLLERRRGGRDGGETLLSDAGREWVSAYGQFERQVERAVDRAFSNWQTKMGIGG